ncbi:MAG: hypothetical protein ABH826_02140 [Patescibacteria group bacterium]|nr:hypothetical protein [Patescibacteria group bacterium]
MKRLAILLSCLALAIALYFFVAMPGTELIKSADGKLIIEGSKADLAEMTIEEYPIFTVDNLDTTAYEVASPIELADEITLYFDMRDRQDADQVDVFVLDPVFDMWTWQKGELKDGLLSISTDQPGWFTTGRRQEINLPDFSADLPAILEHAPLETVGFNIALGYFSEEMHETLLNESMFQGGCAGRVEKGSGFDSSRIEKQSNVLIDEQEENVIFVFIAEWWLKDGCKAGEDLEAAF